MPVVVAPTSVAATNSLTPLAWGVGLLTCPRPGPSTFDRALASLHAAGWSAAEIAVHNDDPPSGCYQGWLKMACRTLCDFPQADYLLLVEDDCELSAGLRAWLEHCIPTDPALRRPAWHSLYTAAELHSAQDLGWREVPAPRQCWGSLAYVVQPKILKLLLADPPQARHRDGTDRAVGHFCRQHGFPYLVHSPSFARHLGTATALDRPGGTDLNRQCACWVERIRWSESDGRKNLEFEISSQPALPLAAGFAG
jgi:hypothetical protein